MARPRKPGFSEHLTWSTSTPKLYAGATIAAQNTEGVYFSQASGDGFENLSATAGNVNKRYVRHGIWALNNPGSSVSEIAVVSLSIERKRS